MSSSVRLQDISTLQKRMQQWLKHPAVWSGIASVGVHGLLFGLLPLLPTDALKEDPPDLQRSVDLVELTPEEQQRLPDFPSEAPIQLPPIAQTPSQSPPDLFSTLPPLPNQSALPPAPSIDPLPLPAFPIFPTLPPPPRFTLRNPEPTTPPRPQTSPQASPQASPTPSPEASPPSIAASPQQASPLPSDPNASPSPPASPEPTQTAQNPPASPQPNPQEQLIARQQELRQLYAYNPQGTSNDEAIQSYTGWLQQVSSELGDDWNEDAQKNLAPSKPPIEIAGAYPRAACVRRLSADVILGVVIDGEGKIVQEPVPPAILRSSGYGIFNQLAVEAAAAHAFEATGKRLPYRVLVKFEPNDEVCPPGSGTPAPQASPPA